MYDNGSTKDDNMIKKYIIHLNNFSIFDLLIYSIHLVKDKIDLSVSSLIFKIKCLLNGVKFSGECSIWGKVILRRFPGSKIIIGKGIYLVNRPGRYSFNIYPQTLIRTYSSSSRVLIGENVGANALSIFCRSKSISIGDRTLIGGNCQIMDSDGHPLWPINMRTNYLGNKYDESVEIGNDVYIGLNVIILKGSIIGNGSVIGAGSVVCGYIPEFCVAAGIPARVIRYLNVS